MDIFSHVENAILLGSSPKMFLTIPKTKFNMCTVDNTKINRKKISILTIIIFSFPPELPEKTDIDVRFNPSGNATTVTVNWEMILIPN